MYDFKSSCGCKLLFIVKTHTDGQIMKVQHVTEKIMVLISVMSQPTKHFATKS